MGVFGRKAKKDDKKAPVDGAAAATTADPVGEAQDVPREEQAAPPKAARLTLKELKAAGHIIGERQDGKFTHVVTKGGRKLTFPGDEAKAAALPPQDLDGVPRKEWPSSSDTTTILGKKK